MWKNKWVREKQLAYFREGCSLCFPNIKVLLSIMATLPVTSCECERSICLLRLTKDPSSQQNGAGQT